MEVRDSICRFGRLSVSGFGGDVDMLAASVAVTGLVGLL